MKSHPDGAILTKPTGITDAGNYLVSGVVVAFLTFLEFRNAPAIGVGFGVGVLFVYGLLIVLQWNPKVNHWWMIDSDGTSQWHKPEKSDAKRIKAIPWSETQKIRVDAVSPFLQRGVLIYSKTGSKIWIPKQTDRYVDIVNFLEMNYPNILQR